MDAIPKLSRATIKNLFDPRSFERGQNYFRDRCVFDTTRTGRVLKGRCTGSQGGPYRLTVTFDAEGHVARASCSCPVGSYCKHLAAMLLLWAADPDAFAEVEDIEASLNRRSKQELVFLVRQMLRQDPELEPLLSMPAPGTKGNAPKSASFQTQTSGILRALSGHWGSGREAAEKLEGLAGMAEDYLAAGDAKAAAAVYEGIGRGIIDDYEAMEDENGHLAVVVADCADGMAKCLDALKDRSARRTTLKSLFDLYVSDIEFGGVDLSGDAVGHLVDKSSPSERKEVAGWVEEALKRTKDDWARDALQGLLDDLS